MEGNPELKELLSTVGITESQLQNDKDLSKFVNDFIEDRGGIDAVKRDRERERAHPPVLPPSFPSMSQSLPPAPPVPPSTHVPRASRQDVNITQG